MFLKRSTLSFAVGIVQISAHKDLPLDFVFRGPQVGSRHLLYLRLVVLGGLGPLLLGVEDPPQVLLRLLADVLLLLADADDLLSGLEGLSHDLREGLLVQVCLLGQLHVVVGDALVEHPCDLLEDLVEVLLELGSEAVEELVDVLLDLLPVYLGQVALHLLVDPPYQLLQALHLPLQLLELTHHLLQLYVDQILHELLLQLLHRLPPAHPLHCRVHPRPLHLHALPGERLGTRHLLRVHNLVQLLLCEGRLQYLRVVDSDNLYLLLRLIEGVDDRSSPIRHSANGVIGNINSFLFV